MTWTRTHLDRMAKLQLQVQTLVSEAGTDAPGTDRLIQANELLTKAQELALEEVKRSETALEFAEGLRPFAMREQ